MKTHGAGSKQPGALKRFINRALAATSESRLFKISRREVEALAKRAWFMRHNRELIIKQSLRLRLVKDDAVVPEQLSWAAVFDGLMPFDTSEHDLPHVREVEAIFLPKVRRASASTQDECCAVARPVKFTESGVQRLHLIVLETAVEAALINKSRKAKEDALRWIFRPEVVAHPSAGRLPIRTSKIPFNFRLCCSMVGSDPGEVQQRILDKLDANERTHYEYFSSCGDGEISNRGLRNPGRGKRHGPSRGWHTPADTEENSGLRLPT